MDIIAFALHLINFALPALFLAIVLTGCGKLVWRAQPGRWSSWQQIGILFGLGLAVLVAGLMWFGTDGKMLTYLALVLVCGTSQWLMRRGSRP